MFEDSKALGAACSTLAGAGAATEQRSDSSARLLLRLLDEIDYGLMLLQADGSVRVANRPARAECGAACALRFDRGRLTANAATDQAALLHALGLALQGRRSMLSLGGASLPVHLAFVPLDSTGGDDKDAPAHVLVVFGKRQVCEALSVDFFARTHRLTAAEVNVLQALCSGLGPSVIARRFGVAVSTIRTQITSIRLKTAARSISDLVKQVAVLPPIVPALRGADPAATCH